MSSIDLWDETKPENENVGFFVLDVPARDIETVSPGKYMFLVNDEKNNIFRVQIDKSSILGSYFDENGAEHYNLTFTFDELFNVYGDAIESEYHKKSARWTGHDLYDGLENGYLSLNKNKEGSMFFFRASTDSALKDYDSFLNLMHEYDDYEYIHFVLDGSESVEDIASCIAINSGYDDKNNDLYHLTYLKDDMSILSEFDCKSNLLLCYQMANNFYKSYEAEESYGINKVEEAVNEMKPESDSKRYDFANVCNSVKGAAWSGGDGKRQMSLLSEDGKNQLDFSGNVIEEGYEFFVPTVSVRENGELLFYRDARCVGSYHNEPYVMGKFDTLDETIGYLNGTYGNTNFREVDQSVPNVPLPTDESRWENPSYRKQQEAQKKYADKRAETDWNVFKNVSSKNVSKNSYNGDKAVRIYDSGSPISMLVKESYVKKSGTNQRGNVKYDITIPASVEKIKAKGADDYSYRDRYVMELLDIHNNSLEEARNYSAIQEMVNEAASTKVKEDVKER